MGCDGGTIPKRDELVKTKKKPEQKDKAAELAHRWQNCAISQAALQEPVVACELGRLYSKETILETLLDKSTPVAEPSSNNATSHIKSLRDVKTLNLTENPDWSKTSTAEKGDSYIDMQKSKWICPVSGQEMNGRFKFVFLWSCGCVMSEKALKELTKTKKDAPFECLKCQKPFELLDVVVLNPVEAEDISAQQEKMEVRRSKVKALKDAKKSKKVKSVDPEPSTSTTVVKAQNNGIDSQVEENQSKAQVAPSSKLEKRKVENSASKVNGQNGVKKSKTEGTNSDPINKLVNYSVAKDPSASSTYKSLFTSSEKGQGQQRAHWVTYNPFYN